MTRIATNPFVKRQTKESEFSYFDGTWEEVEQRVQDAWERRTPGYREGVVLVPVDPAGFYSSVIQLQPGDKLVGEFKARREGEEPTKCIRVLGTKMPAAVVDVVLYHSSVLKEDGDNSIDDGWEIISVNAMETEGEQPINPGALMRNFFHETGGTDTKMSDSEFVAALKKSRDYWRDKALASRE